MNDETEVLDFDITERTLPVKIGGEGCTLHEASEAVAKSFRTLAAECGEYEDGKLKRLHGIGKVQSFLVAACLTKDGAAGTSKPVTEAEVNKWPSRVVKALFAKAKKISDLDEAPETVASVTAQLAKLEKRLEELKAEKPDPNL
jgi:hypothetical protein